MHFVDFPLFLQRAITHVSSCYAYCIPSSFRNEVYSKRRRFFRYQQGRQNIYFRFALLANVSIPLKSSGFVLIKWSEEYDNVSNDHRMFQAPLAVLRSGLFLLSTAKIHLVSKRRWLQPMKTLNQLLLRFRSHPKCVA